MNGLTTLRGCPVNAAAASATPSTEKPVLSHFIASWMTGKDQPGPFWHASKHRRQGGETVLDRVASATRTHSPLRAQRGSNFPP
eukprot:7484951-Pyramimonas_sp.AAC.1